MTEEKFTGEIATLKKFFTIYCHGKKHNYIKEQKVNLNFNNKDYKYTFQLCDECFKLLEYSIMKLEKCPYDTKPRCRTCANPCYEPYQWKKVAKIMKHSGIQLGLRKIKNLFVKKKMNV
jgi:hypothetical protein